MPLATRFHTALLVVGVAVVSPLVWIPSLPTVAADEKDGPAAGRPPSITSPPTSLIEGLPPGMAVLDVRAALAQSIIATYMPSPEIPREAGPKGGLPSRLDQREGLLRALREKGDAVGPLVAWAKRVGVTDAHRSAAEKVLLTWDLLGELDRARKNDRSGR
jgi:hypothetical protein